MVRCVILDADGVLVDSYAGYRQVWRQWCDLRGVDFEIAWAATHARRPVDTIADVAPHLDPLDEYEILQAIAEDLGDVFPLYHGAAELLTGLPVGRWGIVTSGRRVAVQARLRAGGIEPPPVVVDGNDVQRGKPSPEGYLRAAGLLNVAPSTCLVVEDAPMGIAAAKTAGMHTIAVTSTHEPQALIAADVIVSTLTAARTHILAWLDLS